MLRGLFFFWVLVKASCHFPFLSPWFDIFCQLLCPKAFFPPLFLHAMGSYLHETIAFIAHGGVNLSQTNSPQDVVASVIKVGKTRRDGKVTSWQNFWFFFGRTEQFSWKMFILKIILFWSWNIVYQLLLLRKQMMGSQEICKLSVVQEVG